MGIMEIRSDLHAVQALIMDRASQAVAQRDFSGVARLSGLAKECQSIESELAIIARRIAAVRTGLNGSAPSESTATSPQRASAPHTISAKAAGAEARNEWVASLQQYGIALSGHGKRYRSARGESVAIAFANELPGHENRWFLGLSDESTDVAILLCRSLSGRLYDLVMPVPELRGAWRLLARNRNQIKFNLRKDANRFFLLVPASEPLDVTKYVGNHDPLR